MHVANDAIGFAAHDEADFGVGFEALDPVDDLRTGARQRFGPIYVAGFVKARLQLDERRHVFAALRGARQGGNHRAVVADAVEDLLDGQHVRVVRRFLQQAQHWVITFVGVQQQEIAAFDDVKHGLQRGNFRHGLRMPGSIFERLKSGQSGQTEKGSEVQRAGNGIDAGGCHLQRFLQECARLARCAFFDFQADAIARLAFGQHFAHLFEEVAGLVFAHAHVGVASDAKRGAFGYGHAGEEPPGIGADDFFQQNVGIAAIAGQSEKAREIAWHGDNRMA